MSDVKRKLRSHQWFWGIHETGLLHMGALRSGGIDMDDYHGQPVIGIANTWGEVNNCNMSLRTIAEHVKTGIREAGGIPLEFPVITLGEELMKPTAGLYRNLLSMDVEENLRSYPVDGVVLLGNCDKTVPGLLMGALSANLPLIQLNAGPKKVGMHKGVRMGSGTDLWKSWDELRTGTIDNEEWQQIGKALSCGVGSCNTMGTASTMNALLEGLGVMPLGLSTLGVDAQKRYDLSRIAGNQIVQMVNDDFKPSDFITIHSFKNAIALCMALGGSTNAILHLTALAGRMNLQIYPQLFNEMGSVVPCITNVQPSGAHLIDEFNEAGGVPAVLAAIEKFLDLNQRTFTGQPLSALIPANPPTNEVIHPVDQPLLAAPSIRILQGNLAPSGAVIKVAAASPHLLHHTGKAVVFDNYDDMLKRIDDPHLDVDASSVLVLRHAGPKAVPGMPEWGMIPIPAKLRSSGVSDMVRISDARMSGTSFGTVVLHIAPEAAAGGTLSIVQNGDLITIDVAKGVIELHVKDEEIAARKKLVQSFTTAHRRGYPLLYVREVLQADEGCDFAFLRPRSTADLAFIASVVGRS